MAIPQTKQQLLQAINMNFDRLIKDLRSLPIDLTNEKTMQGHAGGTLMSASDLVAYLIGWNELVIKWLEKDRAKQQIDFPDTGFKWNELGKLAQKFYSDYDGIAFAELLQKLSEAKNKIVMLIESRNNTELYACEWYGKWTMGRMIQFNTSSPYSNARTRLRKWLKSKSE